MGRGSLYFFHTAARWWITAAGAIFVDDQQMVREHDKTRAPTSSKTKFPNIFPLGTAVCASDFHTVSHITDDFIIDEIHKFMPGQYHTSLAYDCIVGDNPATAAFLVVAGDSPARWIVLDRTRYDLSGFSKDDVMAPCPDDDQKVNHEPLKPGKGKSPNWLTEVLDSPKDWLPMSVWGKSLIYPLVDCWCVG